MNMSFKTAWRACAAGLALALVAGTANAQLAVSINDGKQIRAWDGVPGRVPDEMAVIDLGASPPKVVGRVAVPVGMIGPPSSAAMTPDGRFAILTASQAVDNAGPEIMVLDDLVSVVDVSNPAQPKVTQTLHAGAGATGVSVNKAGTLALVASTAEETISIFTIAGGQLTLAGKVKMPIGSRPVDVVFTPDGRSAYVTAQNAGRLFKLSVDGAKVARSDAGVQTGLEPFQAVTSRDGRYVYVTHLSGRALAAGEVRAPGPRTGTVAIVDTTTGALANIVDMGIIPEHISVSPDGKYLVAVVVNGSSARPELPNYNAFGFLKVFRIEGSNLVPAGEARTGRWCQGALWTSDSKRIILQCAIDRYISAFRVDGKTVTPETGMIKFTARPGAFASAGWR